MIIFKMALVAWLGLTIGNALAVPTKNIITPTLMYVLLGLACEGIFSPMIFS